MSDLLLNPHPSKRTLLVVTGAAVALTLIVVSLGGVGTGPRLGGGDIKPSSSSTQTLLGEVTRPVPLGNQPPSARPDQRREKEIPIVHDGEEGKDDEDQSHSRSLAQIKDDKWYAENRRSRIQAGAQLSSRFRARLPHEEGFEDPKSRPPNDLYLAKQQWQSTVRRFCPGLELIRRVSVTWTSDIAELLPILEAYADEVDTVVEAGSRHGLSTVALMNRFPSNLSSMEIAVHRPLHSLHRYHRDCNEALRRNTSSPKKGSTLNTALLRRDVLSRGQKHQLPSAKKGGGPKIPHSRIDEGDDILVGLPFRPQLLFLDTLHNYDQLYRELEDFHSSVTQWIVLHDTQSYRLSDEEPSVKRKDVPKRRGGGKPQGLATAVRHFLTQHGDEWTEEFNFVHNNGLLVLRRSKIREALRFPSATTKAMYALTDQPLTVPRTKTSERRIWALNSTLSLGITDVTLLAKFLTSRADDVEGHCKEVYAALFAPTGPGHLCPVMPHMVPGLGPGIEYYRTMVIEADRIPIFSRVGLLSGLVFPSGASGPTFVLAATMKHDFDRVVEMTALVTVLSVFARFSRKVHVVLPPESQGAQRQVNVIRREMPSLFRAIKLHKKNVVPESDTLILVAATLREFEPTETFLSSSRIIIYGSSVAKGLAKFKPEGFVPLVVLPGAVGVVVYEQKDLGGERDRMRYYSPEPDKVGDRSPEAAAEEDADVWKKTQKYHGNPLNLDLPLKQRDTGLVALPGQAKNVDRLQVSLRDGDEKTTNKENNKRVDM